MTVLEPTQQRPASWDAGSPRFPIDALRIDSVTKRFGEGPDSVLALDGISLRAGRGEFVCVVGASGCGKSTLLSLIAGLDRPTSGALDVTGTTALMFQDAALLPWRTAKANVELIGRVRQLLAQFSDLELRYVRGHSGVPLNERADALAVEAVQRRGSSGWKLISGAK